MGSGWVMSNMTDVLVRHTEREEDQVKTKARDGSDATF